MFGLFGAADRNAQKRRAENRAYERDKKAWKALEEERKNKYEFEKGQFEKSVEAQEANLKQNEIQLISNYERQVDIDNYEFDVATRAFDRSREQADQQKDFNRLAEEHAGIEQTAKLKDDLLGVMIDESQSIMDYAYKTSGLSLRKDRALDESYFEQVSLTTKYINDVGQLQLNRRKERSDSQIKSQQAIVDGLKMAGQIRARAGSGRSATKAMLGVMAESGATRAAIANSLMYAEQDIDLSVAQLKDMMILDQTMIAAAEDYTRNEFRLEKGKLDFDQDLNKTKIDLTRQSIKDRDEVVRKMITTQRRQADLQAEASVLMRPERLPEVPDPRVLYEEFDDPETEDYVELLVRPFITDFPEYVATPKPDKDDYKYSLGRENVGMSNVGDAIGLAGIVAGGIGAVGSIGAVAGGGGLFGWTPQVATTWMQAGTSLGALGSSFYPRR